MRQGIVLFLGMARRGECESLQKRGLPLGILVDSNNKQRLADVSVFALVERFDFSRPVGELVEAVRGIQEREGIESLFNVSELYVSQTAEVAAALGLPGLSRASARLCLDKNPMRQRFQDRIGPDASARFSVVATEAELLASADAFGYPVFLQPSNVSASMWSTRNDTRGALLANYRAMLDEVPRRYASQGQKGKELTVVLAEYLEGENTSIDCLSDHEGRVYPTPIVDVLTGRDIGIDDFHHFARLVPSRLGASEQAARARLAEAGV